MKISFTAATNKEYVMINTAEFDLQCGIRVTVDRDETEWSIKDGILEMEWNGCYLWEINGINISDGPVYLNESAPELFKGAVLAGFNIEDDADENYTVTGIRFSIS